MNKQLKLFIDFLDGNDKDCCDLDFLQNSNEWLIPMLGKKAPEFFRIYFRNKAGDLCGEWDEKGKLKNEKDFTFVWLSSEGSPRTVIAKSPEEFLSLLPYGQNVYTGIQDSLKANKENPGIMLPTEQKFSNAAIQESLQYQSSVFEGHGEMVKFIVDSLGIALAADPVSTIRSALDSFPNLDEWIDENLSAKT